MQLPSDTQPQMEGSNSQWPSGFWSLSRVCSALGFTWPVRQPSLCPTLHSQPWVIGGEKSETISLSGPKLSEVTGKIITEVVDLWIDVLPPVFQSEVSYLDKIHFGAVSGLICANVSVGTHGLGALASEITRRKSALKGRILSTGFRIF